MFYDDLPVWGFIGKMEKAHAASGDDASGTAADGGASTRLYLFTHLHFDLAYNEDRVIEINISTVSKDPKMTVDITEGDSIQVRRQPRVTPRCLIHAVASACCPRNAGLLASVGTGWCA